MCSIEDLSISDVSKGLRTALVLTLIFESDCSSLFTCSRFFLSLYCWSIFCEDCLMFKFSSMAPTVCFCFSHFWNISSCTCLYRAPSSSSTILAASSFFSSFLPLSLPSSLPPFLPSFPSFLPLCLFRALELSLAYVPRVRCGKTWKPKRNPCRKEIHHRK